MWFAVFGCELYRDPSEANQANRRSQDAIFSKPMEKSNAISWCVSLERKRERERENPENVAVIQTP